jgi:hypothetical protein
MAGHHTGDYLNMLGINICDTIVLNYPAGVRATATEIEAAVPRGYTHGDLPHFVDTRPTLAFPLLAHFSDVDTVKLTHSEVFGLFMYAEMPPN